MRSSAACLVFCFLPAPWRLFPIPKQNSLPLRSVQIFSNRGILCAPLTPWEKWLSPSPLISYRANCREQRLVIIFKLLPPCNILVYMPTTALTTKLPKKNKQRSILAFLPHYKSTVWALLQKRLHQHQADIKHREREHRHMSVSACTCVHHTVHERPLASVLLTTGGRSSSEPGVEEYPSLVTSIIFSSSKCSPRPPSQVGQLSVPGALASVAAPRSHHLIKHKGRKRNTGKWSSTMKPPPQSASLWSGWI